jgi:hypothetical protein
MDARLRVATSAEMMTAIGKLFRALPPRKASPEELLESYEIACHKATKHAIETVVIKLIRGELNGLSKSFAPSPAELSTAIRDEMEFVRKQIDLETGRMAIADNRPTVIRPKLSMERAAEHTTQMLSEGRHVLAEFPSHDAFLSARRFVGEAIKAGGVYIALTGKLWGAPGVRPAPPADPVQGAPQTAAEAAERLAESRVTETDDVQW